MTNIIMFFSMACAFTGAFITFFTLFAYIRSNWDNIKAYLCRS